MGEQFCFENVTLKFGGVTALNDLSFSVEPGTLHALIGPNGAGKSSVLNVLSGLYQPQSGGVRFGATDLLATAASARPRHGISRTFQNVVLSRRQSVLENLMLGRHHLMRHSFTRAMLRLPSSVRQDAEHEAACTAIAERLGIGVGLRHRHQAAREHDLVVGVVGDHLGPGPAIGGGAGRVANDATRAKIIGSPRRRRAT